METSRTMVCPACGQYIMSDADKCRHCGVPISLDMAEEAADKETEVIRKHYRKYYWFALITGSFMCIIGGGATAAMLSGATKGAIYTRAPLALIVGLVELGYAINGFLDTARTKKKKQQNV